MVGPRSDVLGLSDWGLPVPDLSGPVAIGPRRLLPSSVARGGRVPKLLRSDCAAAPASATRGDLGLRSLWSASKARGGRGLNSLRSRAPSEFSRRDPGVKLLAALSRSPGLDDVRGLRGLLSSP
ncbi:MAG: hypothetical protein WAU13_07905, partial [Albidovulum sp.]